MARRLTQPLVLEDGRPPRVLTMTLYTISGFVIAIVIWASLTQVGEITIAPGQIIPQGQVQAVQHLEGGIVAEILVGEGTSVVAHQPLIRLSPESVSGERNQIESRRANLKLQLIRLEAQSRNGDPDFGPLAKDFPDLAAEQENLFVRAVIQRREEAAILLSRVAQKRGDIATLKSNLEAARIQSQLQYELVQMQEKLMNSGLGARKNWLEAKSLHQRAEGDIANLLGKITTAEDALSEAQSSLAEAQAKALQKLGEERAKAAADLSETEQQLVKFNDRMERLMVRSPSAGIVQELMLKSVGEVIRPGDTVARIVPTEPQLVAEVRLDPKDAGHVQLDADVDIRLAPFDSAIFGPVRGKVVYVSPTTFSPVAGPAAPQGQAGAQQPYYKATVRLLQDHVSSQGKIYNITPGMPLQAHIKTGSKSIVRYMFKPIFNSLDVAFHER